MGEALVIKMGDGLQYDTEINNQLNLVSSRSSYWSCINTIREYSWSLANYLSFITTPKRKLAMSGLMFVNTNDFKQNT